MKQYLMFFGVFSVVLTAFITIPITVYSIGNYLGLAPDSSDYITMWLGGLMATMVIVVVILLAIVITYCIVKSILDIKD